MTVCALLGIPRITADDDLGTLITQAAGDDGHTLTDGDVLVIAQRIVSKAEDRVICLDTVTNSALLGGVH